MSKAQTRATTKYKSLNYDRLAIEVKKGVRESIKAYAESQGKSLNQYIIDLVRADMGAAFPSSAPAPSEPAAETTE